MLKNRQDTLEIARSPPTINDSFPCSRVMTLPETGASSIRAPRCATWFANARDFAGLTVLISQ